MAIVDPFTSLPVIYQYRMQCFVLDRVSPGPFLSAVLRNDLRDAVAKATPMDISCLPDIVDFVSRLSENCTGDNVDVWIGVRKVEVFAPEVVAEPEPVAVAKVPAGFDPATDDPRRASFSPDKPKRKRA